MTFDVPTLCKLYGLPAPVPEFRFHDVRRWRLDWAWPDLKVALEIHGGIHRRGRHTRGVGFEGDRDKMNEATLAGWLVIESSTSQMLKGQGMAWIQRAIFQRATV